VIKTLTTATHHQILVEEEFKTHLCVINYHTSLTSNRRPALYTAMSEKKRSHDDLNGSVETKAEKKARKEAKKKAKAEAAGGSGEVKAKKEKKDKHRDSEAEESNALLDVSPSSSEISELLLKARHQLMAEATEGPANDGSINYFQQLLDTVSHFSFDEDDSFDKEDYVIHPWNPVNLFNRGFLRYASPLAGTSQQAKTYKLVNLGKSESAESNHCLTISYQKPNNLSRSQRGRKKPGSLSKCRKVNQR
jgi:hypothetical protein